jgi:hypothetical protein
MVGPPYQIVTTAIAIIVTLVAARSEEMAASLSELKSPDAPVFNSKGHPKGHGLTFELKYPNSWLATEGKRPAILQKFRSEGGEGLMTVTVNVVPVPREFGDVSTTLEEEKYLNQEAASAMLGPDSKILTLKQTKIDGEPTTMFEFTQTMANAGLDLEIRGLQFCTIVDQHMLMLSGMLLKSPTMGATEFGQQWALAKLVTQTIAGGLYFPDKWNQPQLTDADGADAAALPITTNGYRHSSKEFGFAATFPDEVEPLIVPYNVGRIGTFQAVDEENKLVVMVTANLVSSMRALPSPKESTQKQLIEAMVTKNAEEHGARKGALKTEWSTLHGRPALDFNYTTDGFAPQRVTTYHVGKSSFDGDTFYHLQVVAFEKDNRGKEILGNLAESFSFAAD